MQRPVAFKTAIWSGYTTPADKENLCQTTKYFFVGASLASSPYHHHIALDELTPVSNHHECCTSCKEDNHEACEKIDTAVRDMYWCCCGYKIVVFS
jgi:hypothetical protein